METAPTLVASTLPLLNSISVGIPRIPNLGGVAGFGGLALISAGPLGLVMGAGAGFFGGGFLGRDHQFKGDLGVLQEAALASKAFARMFLGKPINYISGKEVIKDQSEYETKLKEIGVSERDIKNMKANLIDIGMILGTTALLLMTKALFWDDDDEEDDTRRLAHNLLANRFMQLAGQASLFINVQETTTLFTDPAFKR